MIALFAFTALGCNSDNESPNPTADVTINIQGDLAYHCTIHPTMTGTLHVTP
jgi:plastocyanin